MVFKPHKSRLHLYDQDDPRGLASHCFMETVESNMRLFTKRQIHGANLAHNLQAGLAFPSNADMKWAIKSNLIKDCPVTVKDMVKAIKTWGPSIAMLKGKTVRRMPPVVRQDVIEIPKEIWELHKDVTLTIDIFLSTRYHSSPPTAWSYAFYWRRTWAIGRLSPSSMHWRVCAVITFSEVFKLSSLKAMMNLLRLKLGWQYVWSAEA